MTDMEDDKERFERALKKLIERLDAHKELVKDEAVIKWPETRPACPWCKEIPELTARSSYGPHRVRCMNNNCHVQPATRECNRVSEAWGVWENAFRA